MRPCARLWAEVSNLLQGHAPAAAESNSSGSGLMIVEMKAHTFQPVVVFPVAPECRQTDRAKLTSRVGTNPIFNSTRPEVSGERPVNGWSGLWCAKTQSGQNGSR